MMANAKGNSKPKIGGRTSATIQTSERAKQVKAGMPSAARIQAGLARVGKMPELTPEQTRKALSGYILGLFPLDKEQIACLKLLGEHYGLWGAGRKPPATPDDGDKVESFTVKDAATPAAIDKADEP